MGQTLYLTDKEQKLFEALSSDIQEGWSVEQETQTSYESPAALDMRVQISSWKDDPLVQDIVKSVEADKKPENATLPELSEEQLADFFFTIGAVGQTLFIVALLQDAKDDDDLQGVAHLTQMRHQMLKTNADISYSL
jgi:hypothetical protein